MKRIIKYSLYFLVVAVSFTACSDYKDTETLSEAISSSNQGVRFAKDNVSKVEVTPSEAFAIFKVVRSKDTDAYSYPLTVISDTSNIFIFPENVSFAAGQAETTIKVALKAEAEYEVEYGFKVSIDDVKNINQYKQEIPVLEGSLSISLWEYVGVSQFFDSFAFNHIVEVDFYIHAIDKGKYRISNPYTFDVLDAFIDEDGDPWGDWIAEDLDAQTDPYLVFEVDENGVVEWDVSWRTGLLYRGDEDSAIEAVLPTEVGEENVSKLMKDDDGNDAYLYIEANFYIFSFEDGFGTYPVYVGFPDFDLSAEIDVPVLGEE